MSDAAVSNIVLGECNTMYDHSTEQFHFSSMGARDMCRECYCFMNGLSPRKLQDLLTKWKSPDAVRSVSRKPGQGRKRSRESVDCECWFRELIELMGEPAPDSDNVYLPPGTKTDYFKQYTADNLGKPTLRPSAFFRLWAQQFHFLKVPFELTVTAVDR